MCLSSFLILILEFLIHSTGVRSQESVVSSFPGRCCLSIRKPFYYKIFWNFLLILVNFPEVITRMNEKTTGFFFLLQGRSIYLDFSSELSVISSCTLCLAFKTPPFKYTRINSQVEFSMHGSLTKLFKDNKKPYRWFWLQYWWNVMTRLNTVR